MEVENMEHFIDWLVTNHTQMEIAGQAKENLSTLKLASKEKDNRISALTSITGISYAEAENLLQKFGSIPKILNSRQTQKNLMEVPGIGREKAKRILSLREYYE